MSHLTELQRSAVQNAQALLESAGLSPRDLDSVSPSPSPTPLSPVHIASTPLHLSTVTAPAIQHACSHPTISTYYIPPPARPFTDEDRVREFHRVTRRTSAHSLVEHPVGAIVEYPQTGQYANESVAHIFHIDPTTSKSSLRPQSSFQYSLGDGHGGKTISRCLMLRDAEGHPVSCTSLKTSCTSLKICSARKRDMSTHHSTNIFEVSSHCQTVSRTDSNSPASAADREIFERTLALYMALYERGCSAIDGIDDHLAESVIDDLDVKKPRCSGKLIMQLDAYNQPFVRCKLRSHTRRTHLFIRNLQECDTRYLQALLDDDHIIISECEQLAKSQGYGPLLPCSYVTSPSSQRQVCPHLHRQADGKLKQGVLRKWTHNCTAKFNIYVPHDLVTCPRIVVLCSNPHSHPPPAPVKTPTPLVDIFHELLLLMKWKLADATPRRIYLDTAFIQGLHEVLGWDFPDGRDATLQDLHPSLANLDHVRRLINILRSVKYPSGTGFEGRYHYQISAAYTDMELLGARLLAEEHAKLPLEQRYVRCAETHIIERGATLKLVICMTPRMSLHLMQATRLSIDTSFKRAQGWQEFEIESWNVEHQQSVVSSRAFTTSQSAKAHLILFERIFEIASTDTGLPVSFNHIHGCGFETVIADSHKGQGLGLGMYCMQLSRSLTMPCPYESQRRLCDLGPYDHLRRFYRLCVAHYKRNVHGLYTHVSDKVYTAMLSLATSEPHPDIQKTLDIIRNGGPKAAAWLKDKLEGTKFAFPAIYQPASLIPLAFWKASPATTNGNEQSHRNAYREGIHLTLLAGLMKGMRYDQGATNSMDVHTTFGVSTRDQGATYIQRAKQCIMRQSTNLYCNSKH
ncbi:uncharacterized protein F5891DRAFT_967475 [Suillus fuscotomentosus]|uniref:Uncharacterized protein n=1 Tax=Suillus fuscotomentosus TaxID=1912939 RepID=A0AAD4HCM1_9AGAM|nr:uncharacterized protein F5891DRAFT_967475 [Suillus fuscotomentosus]KAG1887408.1 hypothetical protein F5891DRAFT_967475 [Suillus fuscotomentosus]